MDDPSQYRKFNKMQYKLAEEIMESYKFMFENPQNASETTLDIGCADGKVTALIILPALKVSKHFKKLVAIDLSPKMTDDAKLKYPDKKLEFRPFEFCGNKVPNKELKLYSQSSLTRFFKAEPVGYDHITSFTALHWIYNQKLVFNNIYELLKPGGDFIVSMVAFTSLYEAMYDLKRMKEWAPYTENYDKTFPWQKSKDPIGDCINILSTCNFTKVHVELIDRPFEYDDYDHLKSKCSYFQKIKMFFLYIFLFRL